MKKINRDERFFVAEEAIITAFYLLLKENPIDKITVSMVIKKAGIVRSTFYNHYETMEDLIASIEDGIVANLRTSLQEFHPAKDILICQKFYKQLCLYIKGNPLLTKQLESPSDNRFISKIIMVFHEFVGERTNEKDVSSFQIAYLIGGCLGLLHKWVTENFKSSVEEISDILANNTLMQLRGKEEV